MDLQEFKEIERDIRELTKEGLTTDAALKKKGVKPSTFYYWKAVAKPKKKAAKRKPKAAPLIFSLGDDAPDDKITFTAAEFRKVVRFLIGA